MNIYNNELVEREIFSKYMRDYIVDYSFLHTHVSWEQYMEKTFLGYLLGCNDKNGKLLNTFVAPKDEMHAYSLVTGVNNYPDWGNLEKIIKSANDYFEEGGPYEKLRTMNSELNAIKKIRNRIAHLSVKSKNDFESLVRSKLGHLPNDINTAAFLVENSVKVGKKKVTYFEYYVEKLKDMANLLIEL